MSKTENIKTFQPFLPSKFPLVLIFLHTKVNYSLYTWNVSII